MWIEEKFEECSWDYASRKTKEWHLSSTEKIAVTRESYTQQKYSSKTKDKLNTFVSNNKLGEFVSQRLVLQGILKYFMKKEKCNISVYKE